MTVPDIPGIGTQENIININEFVMNRADGFRWGWGSLKNKYSPGQLVITVLLYFSNLMWRKIMELLVHRLETLVNADVSREEVLRQLNKAKPGLKKGEVLANAKILTGVFTPDADRRRAEEFLKDIMPLYESYITSAGPLGTTTEDVTVWDNPKKPMRFVGSMIFFSSMVIGFALGTTNSIFSAFMPFVVIFGIIVAFAISAERAVTNNKWKARQELDKNIIRRAEFFESMLEKVSFN